MAAPLRSTQVWCRLVPSIGLQLARAAAPRHVPWTHWVVAARYVSALTVYYSAMGQLVSSAVDESRAMQPIAPVRARSRGGVLEHPVSYTHLTLPTILRV